MKPGATKRPVQSSASSASVRVPGSCTLATSGPTTPTSAARSSPHPTSTSVPPVRSRSNGSRALRGGDGAVARREGSTGSIGIRRSSLRCASVADGDEVGEDAAQLDAGAVGAHVHLGGDVERQPPVDVRSWSSEVLVEDLLLERDRRRPAGRRRRGRCGAARCRCGSARRPRAARRSRARWCRPPARSRCAGST